MPAFPTLSKPPSYPLDPDGDIDDGILRSPKEAGYDQTRPRFTRTRRTWGVTYKGLPDADVVTLRAFEITTLRNGADLFTWAHPLEGNSYTVRLAAPIKFQRAGIPLHANVSFTLREV